MSPAGAYTKFFMKQNDIYSTFGWVDITSQFSTFSPHPVFSVKNSNSDVTKCCILFKYDFFFNTTVRLASAAEGKITYLAFGPVIMAFGPSLWLFLIHQICLTNDPKLTAELNSASQPVSNDNTNSDAVHLSVKWEPKLDHQFRFCSTLVHSVLHNFKLFQGHSQQSSTCNMVRFFSAVSQIGLIKSLLTESKFTP